ncbi:MAG: TetR/AcrR family transcriptional regulator [Sphingobacterium sp.]
MTIKQRKQRHQEIIKKQIIDCSWRIVEESGWNALTIRKIADAIEYSVPVIYKHFENKEAITTYFLNQGLEKLNNMLDEAIKTEVDPQKKIKKFAKGYWDFSVNFPKHYEIIFGLGIPSCDSVIKFEELGKISNKMLTLIDELAKVNDTKNIDRYLKLKTLWSILHGIIAVNQLSIEQKEVVCPTDVFSDAIDGFSKSILYN